MNDSPFWFLFTDDHLSPEEKEKRRQEKEKKFRQEDKEFFVKVLLPVLTVGTTVLALAGYGLYCLICG